ncbi:flagellar hook-length control protein FliK [Marinobacter salinisoli]|uniref:Flagellar hook-length control protein FliK n=1 Tax=Marinobacter salinisoli TaxID=2769486 RepID=A0ABX7MQ02_9GAMM|nr:flagellar hook-length control protein FliK [Marinobacter salinisoli]QSP94402.1 flagellar hook-length control protein FliK [Marinobacter salinisoli]
MPQTVLPLTPSPGGPNDSSATKSRAGKAADPDGRFESVSREEQKKLDARTDKRREETESAERPAEETSQSETASAPGADKASDSAAGNKPEADRDDAGVATAADPETAEPVMVPVTFVGLQSLVASGNQKGVTEQGLSAASVPAPGMSAGQDVAARSLRAASASGAQGLIAGQGSYGQGAPGVTAGLQLADVATTDVARPTDAANLAASPRLSATFELASQLSSNPATRLTAETAVPLRSYATSIDLPVGHAEWGDKLVGKLSWLTARSMSVAEIHLTPPDMGPMEVKVRVQNEQANIAVHAANPVVRDQLELHSHRLRDMLAEQGLNLTKFDVSDSPQQQAGQQGAGTDADGGAGDSGGELAAVEGDEDMAAGALDLSWNGEIDVFA